MAVIRGGDKFEAALAKIASQLREARVLRVGFLEGATYPSQQVSHSNNPKPRKKHASAGSASGPLNVATVAAFNEYGVPSHNQPPRPFFRNMIADKSPEWPKAIAKLLKSTNYDAQKTLEITGEAIKGQLQKSIIDLVAPPLAPSTIRAKGSAKPLIDTSHMLNSVDYEVVSK